MLPDLTSFALASFALGQIGLSLTLLMTQSVPRVARVPLFILLVACAIILGDPVILGLMPSVRLQAFALTLPAYLVIAPALWLYVEALTSETDWNLRRKHGPHFILCLLGLGLSILVASLPKTVLEDVFFEETLGGSLYLGFLFTAVFCLLIALFLQSGFYLVKIYRHLRVYRKRIKDNFANVERRDLIWIDVILLLLVLTWVCVGTRLIFENIFNLTLFDRRTGSLLGLILVWVLSIWGLRQRRGFEEPPIYEKGANPTQSLKYSRSALNEDQAQRIAKKIASAMESDRLYLDPNLSLSKLAKHIGASSNHVSQTLNGTLGLSFFDHVNRERIEHAKPEVLSGEKTILNVALEAGFNTSSSFYKAFKAETGLTPRAYRASHEKL